MTTDAFTDALLAPGTLVAAVPCSELGAPLAAARARRDVTFVNATSEGEAVAVAAGAALAGRPAVVLMQNSGLGNAVNPLTSLALPFGLPLLLVVSLRGTGGADAPQHAVMGPMTAPLLDLMDIGHGLLSDDGAALVRAARARIGETSRPFAILVPRGALPPAPEPPPRGTSRPAPADLAPPRPEDGGASPPTRAEALAALLGALAPDDLVVATTGHTARELAALEDRRATFSMVGSMGCAAGLGLGLALSLPERRVVVVDGDGALLMKAGTLATVGALAPGRLVHVVLDNGVYASTGHQPCVSAEVSLPLMATACGYRRVEALGSADGLARALGGATPAGPAFLHLPVVGTAPRDLPRVPRTPRRIRDDFMEAARAPVPA